jgi:hypothetical protein
MKTEGGRRRERPLMEGSEEQREGGLIGREEGSGREVIKVERGSVQN